MHIWGAKESYTVGEMHSHDQARLVEEALARIPGIARVRADPGRHTVSIVYKMGELQPGAVELALRRLGFTNVRRA